jgi:DNA anti-recombination protein RmuC
MPTLEERVAALEAKLDAQVMSTSDMRSALTGMQDQMNRRFEQVDQRFVDLQNQMNRRFDAVDQKIDRHFTWLIGIQVAVLVGVVGALVGSYYR